MKRLLHKLLLLADLMLTGILSLYADRDVPVNVDQLPAAAQTTLRQCFADLQVVLAKRETGLFNKGYEVVFSNGNKIEFDAQGQWTDVECKQGTVPDALVPAAVRQHLSTNYPQARVIKLERNTRRTEVELSNGLELTFNAKGQLVDFDS